MYLPNNNHHKNGHERQVDRGRIVYVRPDNNDFLNHNRILPMEPTFKLWLAILNGLGLTTTIGVVVFDWASWKANILFMVGLVFLLIRIYYYVVNQSQQKELRELEIEEKKRRLGEINWDTEQIK
jgi:hypothetical protein